MGNKDVNKFPQNIQHIHMDIIEVPLSSRHIDMDAEFFLHYIKVSNSLHHHHHHHLLIVFFVCV